MTAYVFNQVAGTDVASLIGASQAGGVNYGGVPSDIQTNGTGAVNTNDYTNIGLYKTGGNESTITIPTNYTGTISNYVSPLIAVDGTDQGYSVVLYQNSTSGTIFDRIQFRKNDSFLDAPFLVTPVDLASGPIKLRLYLVGSDLRLDIILGNDTLHETISYTDTSALTTQGTGLLWVHQGVQHEILGWDDSLAADNTAPTFTSAPSITDTTDSGHTISATLDEDGTIYAVRLPDGATAPSSAQVKAGQDSTGSAALEAKSVAATASVSADLVFSTADSSTAYDYYVVAEDDEGTPNVQAAPVLVNGTTNAPSLSIVSTDASMQRGVNFQVVIANPPFTPTALNSTLVSGGDVLACTLVEDLGSAQYRLTFQVGDLQKQVSATGYTWSVNLSLG